MRHGGRDGRAPLKAAGEGGAAILAAGRRACEGRGEGSAAGDGGRRLAAPLLWLLSALPCPARHHPGFEGAARQGRGKMEIKRFFIHVIYFYFTSALQWGGGLVGVLRALCRVR